MKNNRTNTILSKAIGLAILLSVSISFANGLIPAVKSGLYYQLGGGQDVPLPAFYETSYVPLSAGSDVGLGFDCGAFNPLSSITHSLNEIKHSALNVEKQVLNSATGAVTEFPMYELSRTDPNLYNLISTAMAGAKEDIGVSTKSCEVMQSQINSGEDPYAHWAQISLGNRWKQEIGSAELSNQGDINQARYTVSQDAGKSGVPWVNPLSTDFVDNNTHYAGGENQQPIRIIYDSAASGYNVMTNDRGENANNSDAAENQNQSELSKAFPNAKSAADWVTDVVGDETITTYNGGEKKSQPGVGLYPSIEALTNEIEPKLLALVVSNSETIPPKQLNEISPEGMGISPEVIKSIRNQPKVIQSIIVDKISQNIAAMRILNKARLAIRILQSGSRIPAIYNNSAAQNTISHSIDLLRNDMNAILTFIQARQALMSNMLSTVMQAGESQEAQNSAIATPKPNAPIMQNGAIFPKEKPKAETF